LALLLFNTLNYNITLAQSEIIQSSVTEKYDILATPQYFDDRDPLIVNDSQTWTDIENEPEIQSVTPLATSYLFNYEDYELDYLVFGLAESDWNSLVNATSFRIIEGMANISSNEEISSHIPVVGYATSPLVTTDTINLTKYNQNITMNIIGWVFFDVTNAPFEDQIRDWETTNERTIVFITLIQNMLEFENLNFQLTIKLSSEVLNYQDIVNTIATLDTLMNRLSVKYRDYWFYSPVISQFAMAQFFVYAFLGITLIFMLPFFFLAFYISKLSSELNLESRRIQYGLFLTRGVKVKTIIRSYTAEGIILGLLNGILTFFLTPFFGLWLASYLPIKIPQLPLHELFLIFYLDNIYQLGWSVLIGMVLGFLIMRLPHFYLRLSPQELLHQYRTEEAETTKTRGRRDLGILVFGLYPIGTVIFLYLFTTFQAPPIFTTMLLFLGTYSIYIAPFSPFLISYGLSSTIARQPRILQLITRIYTRPFPDMRDFIDRMILSKLYRISRIAFVMSLALTFIIFPLTLSASLEGYNENLAAFNLGGDVKIKVNSNSSLTLETLKQHSHVAAASFIHIGYDSMFTVIYMNSTDYVASVDIGSFWKLNQDDLLALSENTILVSASVITGLGLNIGDSLSINLTDYTISETFNAVGGTDVSFSGIHIVIINQPLDPKEINGRFILKLKQVTSESIKTLYDDILDITSEIDFSAKIDVTSPDENDPSFDILLFLVRILEMQAILLSFVAIFALSFLMIVRVRERTREFGTWRSRGMSNQQLIQGLVVETMSIATLGIITGLITGITLIIGFQSLIITTILEGTTVVPVNMIIPLEMWLLLLFMVLSSIFLAFIIGLWTILTPVSKQIRYEDYV
jgi:ABC-type lipoprotein release transport system permease subunit